MDALCIGSRRRGPACPDGLIVTIRQQGSEPAPLFQPVSQRRRVLIATGYGTNSIINLLQYIALTRHALPNEGMDLWRAGDWGDNPTLWGSSILEADGLS
jgi:hypothetical protein